MASIYRRGRSWYLTWQEGGKQRRRSLGQVSKETARELLRRHENRIALGEPEPVPWHEFLQRYLDWHERTYPASHYRVRDIIQRLVTTSFHDWPTAEQIDYWASQRRVAPGTVNKELRTLKAVLNRAEHWGLGKCPRITMRPEVVSRPPDVFTDEELQRLYQTSHGTIWRFMANTGLRRQEALAARREWVDGGWLVVPSGSDFRTKSGRWRRVPMGQGAIEVLPDLGEDYLLPRMVPNSLTRAFRIDAERGSLHWLRHTYITRLLQAGVSLRGVQVAAGHSSIAVTQRYLHDACPEAVGFDV